MRWRHTRVWQAPWRPLFQGLGQRSMYPQGAWALRAWLRQVRQAQVWHREWLEEMYEWSEPLDRELIAEVEAEENEEEREQRIPQVRQASPPKALPPADTRRTALFGVFDEMEGHNEEFLQDGRPRVENVNDRLSTHGQEADATRKEIDEAFTAWRQSHGSEAP